ncbi:Cd2+/Zn2+-exporting ATPase [Keratinibaculum paraultunense]|uniref:Cd(2+)-exporting ATPase n=1 Tax=Keratinibaculum paraultunense TaxID=1278232 RepID=A0A4R3KY43_9FIRM|nr:heavy metal translocating P-type ATPase [Keratinibaculum paraultunense]QQY80226.1 cadmium-translocating P-type ATPase [Keratinibaculum paraultunense]TCS90738.1 Cd2+/Zn2+-exporting ATPase [Keratinibaculum paraultunense]
MKEIILELEGLNCANCAAKIEKLTKDIDGVDDVSLDFISKKLKVKVESQEKTKNIIDEIKTIVKRLEPDVIVVERDEHDYSYAQGHSHDHGYVKKEDIMKIIFSGILFILPWLLKLEGTPKFIVYLFAYIVVGLEIIIRAFRNLMAGQPFDEYFLMTVATLGAFIIGEYPEGVAVMLFYQIGELFQGLAVNHSRKSISSLLDIKPDYANLEKNGSVVIVNPAEVHVGDYIIVKPGEKIPLDGVIVEGKSSVDTSNITGESVPRTVSAGDVILSGFINNEGLLKIEVTKEFKESTVSKILDLVENASSKKAPTENFITKFARYYTPIVVYTALAIGLIPPLLLGYDIRDWAYRAFVFLVISCPCALVISIPLGFFGGIGGASKVGILTKGGNYLEGLNDVDTMVFDKTGTITKGTFKVTDIIAYNGFTREEVLRLAAYAEVYSNHPIGLSIVEAYGDTIDKNRISDYKEIAGKGIEVNIDGEKIIIGNKKLFDDNSIPIEELDSIGTVAYIGKGNIHVGTIVVSDELKEGVVEDIKAIKSQGVKEIIMLSGDNEETAKKVGELVGIDKVYGNLLPQDKVNIFEQIMEENHGKVAFVGDGVNDAPVLARADIGIAMGGLGSDAAIEAADIVIMTDEIGKISTAMKIAKNTKRIVSQNIVLALAIKTIVLVLGAIGKATMWEAVFADVGVSIIAILNSIRALKIEK